MSELSGRAVVAVFMVVAVLSPSSAAHAATVSFQTTFGPQGANSATGPYLLDGFDSALGVLTGVRLQYDGRISVLGTVTNNSEAGQSVTLESDNDLQLAFSGPLDFTSVVPFNATVAYSAIPAFTTVSFGEFSNPIGASFIADLSTFTRDMPISLTVTDTSTNTLTWTSFVDYSVGMTAGGLAKVTYTYTPGSPTPEPATWSLLVAGFGSVGALLRRRRRGPTDRRVGA
jgi:hypothetical protein